MLNHPVGKGTPTRRYRKAVGEAPLSRGTFVHPLHDDGPADEIVKEADRYTAPAAACAVEILLLLAKSPHPISMSDIARQLGRSKSLVFRVTRELQRREWIARLDGNHYWLALGVLELGAAVTSKAGFLEDGRVILRQLVHETQETANIAVLRGAEVLFVMKQESPGRVVSISLIGRRLPANCVALGKILLARDSDDYVGKLFAAGFPKLSSKSTGSFDELRRELKVARSLGYAVDREGAILGRSAIAVAFRLPGLLGEEAALSLTTDADRFDSRRDELLTALRKATLSLERLGANPAGRRRLSNRATF